MLKKNLLLAYKELEDLTYRYIPNTPGRLLDFKKKLVKVF